MDFNPLSKPNKIVKVISDRVWDRLQTTIILRQVRYIDRMQIIAARVHIVYPKMTARTQIHPERDGNPPEFLRQISMKIFHPSFMLLSLTEMLHLILLKFLSLEASELKSIVP